MPTPFRISGRTGITIRTRTGTPVFSEDAKQNVVPFGCNNVLSPAGATLLAAPGAGKQWVITSLYFSSDITIIGTPTSSGNSVTVVVGGLLSATLGGPGGIQMITAPFAGAINTSIAVTSTFVGTAPHYSISGTAYKATAATITNPAPTQLTATTIDSDTATDLG